MNKVTRIAVGIVITFTMTGGGLVTADSVPAPDQTFIAAVHHADASLDGTSDNVLIETGKLYCAVLNAGHETDPLVVKDAESAEGAAIIRAAQKVYCP